LDAEEPVNSLKETIRKPSPGSWSVRNPNTGGCDFKGATLERGGCSVEVDQIEELIHAFKAERSSGLSEQEYPDKLSVLDKLEELQDLDALDGPRVLSFLVASVANEKEFDLARMHILNMLAHWDYSEEERRMVGLVVLRLLEEDPDWNIRNYTGHGSV